ncbi:MAG TPA: hypothetical protein VFN97_07170 [Actinospica sp.]|nr:hypothetical protein [Actinospica sp.]
MAEPEYIEVAEDESGAVEWLDAPESLEEHAARPRRSRRKLALTAMAVAAVLATSALNASNDYTVIGSTAVSADFGPHTTLVVSTL